MKRFQFSTEMRNARLNQIETTLGVSPKLQIWSGVMPANTSAPNAGALLCEIVLPSDYLNAASGGTKSLTGTWEGVGTPAAGLGQPASYFRLLKATTNAVYCQGNITGVIGEGAMELDDVMVVSGQTVTVVSFTLSEGNA